MWWESRIECSNKQRAKSTENIVGRREQIREHFGTRRSPHWTCEQIIQGSNASTAKWFFQLSLGRVKSARTCQCCTLCQHIFSHSRSSPLKYSQVPKTGEVDRSDKTHYLSDKLTKSRNCCGKLQKVIWDLETLLPLVIGTNNCESERFVLPADCRDITTCKALI